MKHVQRHVAPRLQRFLETFRVVQVAGPRQAGKSTLARAAGGDRLEVSFDDGETQRRAADDPAEFLRGLGDRPVLIDEAQRVPEIYLAIKRIVDIDPTRGRFLLTGSSDPLTDRRILDSLAGRIGIIELRPFSQGELRGIGEGFIDRAFMVAPRWNAADKDGVRDYLPIIMAGGYPEAVALDAGVRTDWFQAYLESTFARDVRDHVDIVDLGRLRRLFDLIASQSGQLLKANSLARDAELGANTVRRWVDVLALTRLVDVIPGWTSGRRGRIVSMPKAYVSDSGLLAGSLGVDLEGAARDPLLLGALVETFVVQELLRQAAASDKRLHPFHYRDRDQREVDLVLERADGQLVGIEIKASTRVRSRDAAGLRALRRASGERFQRGIVLHCGQLAGPIENGIDAVPIAELWRAGAAEPSESR